VAVYAAAALVGVGPAEPAPPPAPGAALAVGAMLIDNRGTVVVGYGDE